jgi:hypothetical protein
MELLMDLKTRLSGQEMRCNRNQRVATFQAQLKLIVNYSIRGDCDDWKRCHDCGLCWLDIQTVAVNVSQLGKLLGKAKSLINTNFNIMGYKIVKGSTELCVLLMSKLPILKTDAREMQHWTIRKLIQQEDSDVIDDEEEDEIELGWNFEESSS